MPNCAFVERVKRVDTQLQVCQDAGHSYNAHLTQEVVQKTFGYHTARCITYNYVERNCKIAGTQYSIYPNNSNQITKSPTLMVGNLGSSYVVEPICALMCGYCVLAYLV